MCSISTARLSAVVPNFVGRVSDLEHLNSSDVDDSERLVFVLELDVMDPLQQADIRADSLLPRVYGSF